MPQCAFRWQWKFPGTRDGAGDDFLTPTYVRPYPPPESFGYRAESSGALNGAHGRRP